MKEMHEIYANQHDLYDSLVNHEDYAQNLSSFLHTNFDFAGKTVCEFGIGTGRVTSMYLGKVKKANLYDLSEHMLEKAKINLANHKEKSTFKVLNNKDIHTIKTQFDFLLEGWSFGHLVSEEPDAGYWIQKLITDSKKLAKTVIFIETMGTFVDGPNPPTPTLGLFYDELKKNGFSEHIIRTDYKFDSVHEAKHVLGSFFGKGMAEKIQEKNESIIKEYTGIWVFTDTMVQK